MNGMKSYDLIPSSLLLMPQATLLATVVLFNHNRLRIKSPNYANVYRKAIRFQLIAERNLRRWKQQECRKSLDEETNMKINIKKLLSSSYEKIPKRNCVRQ